MRNSNKVESQTIDSMAIKTKRIHMRKLMPLVPEMDLLCGLDPHVDRVYLGVIRTTMKTFAVRQRRS
jgi:hypothetical protein